MAPRDRPRDVIVVALSRYVWPAVQLRIANKRTRDLEVSLGTIEHLFFDAYLPGWCLDLLAQRFTVTLGSLLVPKSAASE